MTLNNNNNNNNNNVNSNTSSGGSSQSCVQRQTPSGDVTDDVPCDVTDDAARRPMLPAAVTHIPDELLKSFPHTKRVGNYLLGRSIGEGSFAKVKEALHVITGEQVCANCID